jgi:hypothetical protein
MKIQPFRAKNKKIKSIENPENVGKEAAISGFFVLNISSDTRLIISDLMS